jgi:ppGpp synthetase/RelA/SpoT-type nucleotidyltranferase
MSNLITQYKKNFASYKTITSQFKAMLSFLLKKQALHIHSVNGRTKNKISLENKLIKNNFKYQKLDDITDLCGIRIITYYDDEVDKAATFIRQHFSIDEENSIDKRANLAPNQFGYTSVHLIVNLPVDESGICAGTPARICKVEIQIRSILQHAWAEIEHDLEYKNPAGTTDERRRRFCRLASVLEGADCEFRDIRNSVEKTSAIPATYYASQLQEKVITPQKQSKLYSFLLSIPNYGWAACASMFFMACSLFADWYFNTKITHLVALISTFLAVD